jgi:surfeit locus 1 family protein
MFRHFRPPLIATVAVLLLVPIMLALGAWQLNRADEKRALQAEYDLRAAAGPVGIGAHVQEAAALRFHRVRVRGEYESRFQLLLDNRVHKGRPGYHVVTPLKIEDSEVRVLVNRGWVELGPSREQLPAIETPKGTVEVIGVATVPSERQFILGGLEPLRATGPTVWQQLDLALYARTVPFKLQPVVILLDAASPAGGFIRDWARLDAGIAVHQGYAFQWFTLAAALLALYAFYGRRAARSGRETEERFVP